MVDSLTVLELTGEQLITALENGVSPSTQDTKVASHKSLECLFPLTPRGLAAAE